MSRSSSPRLHRRRPGGRQRGGGLRQRVRRFRVPVDVAGQEPGDGDDQLVAAHADGPVQLVSGPASTTLSANDGAAGGADETTFTIALDTSTGGSKSGTLSLVNSDANESPFDLTLQGAVSSVKMIDDGDSGFVQSGPSASLTWADGYQRDLRYSAKNIAHWAAEDPAAAKLSAAAVLIADLPERHLGLASLVTNTVWLDVDAAGWGWSVVTGNSSLGSEQTRDAGGVDLWRVLTHEFGHLLGLDDLDADEHAGELMAGEFTPQPWQLPELSILGVRRLDLADLAWDGGELLSLKPSRGTGTGGDAAAEVRSAVADLTTRQASEAALLAWADDDDEDEFLAALRRDDEHEHTGRVDRVFEGFGDGGLAGLTWATANRPRNVEKRCANGGRQPVRFSDRLSDEPPVG
ncbi:MAG: hypothetical protein MUE50_12865 [Pirellulaceae bacterium]|nr:hypothetical protein [Pirellulaceae bacterium]